MRYRPNRLPLKEIRHLPLRNLVALPEETFSCLQGQAAKTLRNARQDVVWLEGVQSRRKDEKTPRTALQLLPVQRGGAQ